MSDRIIKKSQVKPAEWKELVDVLRRVDHRKTADTIKDGAVENSEVEWILDRNGDGYALGEDFVGVRTPLYKQLKKIITKHKFEASWLWKPNTYNRGVHSGYPANTPFWSDRDFVLQVVRYNGYALERASKALKKDRTIVAAAASDIHDGDDAIKHADPSLFKDTPFILSLIKKNPRILQGLPASLKRNRKFIISAMRTNGRALNYVSPRFKRDRRVVLAAVKQNGFALFDAHKRFRRNRQIVLAAVSSFGGMLEYAHPKLKKDRKIVLAAVKQWAGAIKYAHTSLKNDPVILRAVAKHSFSNDWRIESKYWTALQSDADVLKYFSKDELADRTSFHAALKKKYNIHFPERLSLSGILEVINNRKNASSPTDNRPLCIIIYPRSDYNGAFGGAPVWVMRAAGYRVIYHEASNERDVVKHLKSATANGMYGASKIILGGHGTSTTLNLGSGSCSSCIPSEDCDIDTSDFNKKDELQLAKYLQADGELFLKSCSNGQGGAANPRNLANTIARTLHPGMMVHSYTAPSYAQKIEIVNGRFKITLRLDDGYRVYGSKPYPPATKSLLAVKRSGEVLLGRE